MLRRVLLLLAIGLALFPGLAAAVEPDEVLPDASLEQRARDISSELRCLVCQNQSIDDSHAALARDLRLLVRERLKSGDSDAQVRDYLVARYGDFVLLKPPFNLDTALLWGLPFLVLVAGAIGLWSARRTGATPLRVAPLSDAERMAIDNLFGVDPASSRGGAVHAGLQGGAPGSPSSREAAPRPE